MTASNSACLNPLMVKLAKRFADWPKVRKVEVVAIVQINLLARRVNGHDMLFSDSMYDAILFPEARCTGNLVMQIIASDSVGCRLSGVSQTFLGIRAVMINARSNVYVIKAQ